MKGEHCINCPFHDKPYVGPVGPTHAKIVILGEAPGEEEEKTGEPFIGTAGRILDKLLTGEGLYRNEIYITNVMKCRPPANRLNTPNAQKALKICACQTMRELETMRPMVIVPTGNTALHALGFDMRIGQARGSIMPHDIAKVIPTWHPAYYTWGRVPAEYVTGMYDWRKINRHSGFTRIITTEENFNISPTVEDVEMFALEIKRRCLRGERPSIYMDLETYVMDSPLLTPIKLVGIAIDKTTAMCIPFITEGGNYYWKTHDDLRRVVMALGDLLEDPGIRMVFFNGLFDIQVLMNHGFTLEGEIFDPMLAHHLIYEPAAHDLGYVASIYTDYPPWKLDKGGGSDTEYRQYNLRDCVILKLMEEAIKEDIRSNSVEWVFNNVMQVIIPTVKMMLNGIYIDPVKNHEVATLLYADTQRLLEELQELCGDLSFNPKSTNQLREILFTKMKLKSQVRTGKTKQLSTAENVLKRLSLRYPDNTFIDKMLEYRKVSKLYGTYANPPILPDGRVHSQFLLHGTALGRFASRNPNVENLPGKRGDSQGYIRRMYCAAPGNGIIEVDFSQAELYIFALLADDQLWLDAFARGEDIHRLNGIALTGEYLEEYRVFYKNFIYGFIYGSDGSEIEKVAPKDLINKISVKEMIQNLEATHPLLFDYRKRTEESVRCAHKVVSPFGRIRWYPGMPGKKDFRSAIHHPISSTVADVMHEKFPKLDEEFDWPTDKIILQLHDAFYVETQLRRVDTIAEKMKRIMEEPSYSPTGLEIKLKADVKTGPNLWDLKKWEPQVRRIF